MLKRVIILLLLLNVYNLFSLNINMDDIKSIQIDFYNKFLKDEKIEIELNEHDKKMIVYLLNISEERNDNDELIMVDIDEGKYTINLRYNNEEGENIIIEFWDYISYSKDNTYWKNDLLISELRMYVIREYSNNS